MPPRSGRPPANGGSCSRGATTASGRSGSPGPCCPRCLSTAIELAGGLGPGRGLRVLGPARGGAARLKDEVPYVVALVELDEGVRLMTNIVDCPVDQVAVGQKVVLKWDPVEDGRAVAVFGPA